LGDAVVNYLAASVDDDGEIGLALGELELEDFHVPPGQSLKELVAHWTVDGAWAGSLTMSTHSGENIDWEADMS
jgi:hypothetical protein